MRKGEDVAVAVGTVKAWDRVAEASVAAAAVSLWWRTTPVATKA